MALRRLRSSELNSDRLLRAAVGLTLVAAALALGGAHPVVNVAIASVLVILLALVALGPRDRGGLVVSLAPAIPALALGTTLLQLVPLPLGAVKVVAPATHDILSLGPLEPVRWAPLSLDPPATAHELVKLVAYVAASLLAPALFGEERRRRELLRWIVAAGGAVLLVGLVQGLARVDRPYGVFGYGGGWLTASFVNPNHLASFLGLASVLSVSLSLSDARSTRWLWLGLAGLLGGGVFASLSRGGILSYAGALVFLGAALAIGRSGRLRSLLWVELGLAVAVLVAGYLAYTGIVHELWTLGRPDALGKTALWKPVPALLRDFPVLGVGRGAMGLVYPRYQEASASLTFTHLENEPLQALVDWGPLVGAALLVLAALAFGTILRRATRSPSQIAAAGALLLVAVHDLGDFSLALSSIALAASMLLSVLVAARDEKPWRLPRGLSGILVLALALSVVAAAYPAMAYRLDADTARLRAALSEPGSSTALRSAFVAPVIRRHPADSVLSLLVAERELRDPSGARQALRWANRGMYLAPGYAAGHLLAARALGRLGFAEQAAGEYAAVCRLDPGYTQAIANELWRRTESAERVAALASDQKEVRLGLARFLLAQKQAAAAVRLVQEPEPIESPEALDILVRALVGLGRAPEALERLSAAQERWPREPAPYLLSAQLLVGRGERSAALSILERGVDRVTDPTSLLGQAIGLLMQDGRTEQARALAQRLVAQTPLGPARAQAHWALGDTYARQGRRASALREYQKARDLAPTELGYRLGIAALREAMGDLKGAQSELVQARAYAPSSAELDEALRRLEAAAKSRDEALWRDEVLGPSPSDEPR